MSKKKPPQEVVERKRHQLELQRKRQASYMENIKMKNSNLTATEKKAPRKILTGKTMNEKKEYNREMKRRSRDRIF